ncbi:hypothetical protein QNH26_03620 [Peribacillus frigoritolerans]|uniref:hypothetical protein n=1 Tax=Peribacillus frigoritolerans TaxID=450367 RepID=UPI0024C1BBDE|nr:hypothetical protein [Peribacillus frigoritolerans]WHX67741.1 hypothetical protein QNH26_03620 [Peribacillus frigoritolerans]
MSRGDPTGASRGGSPTARGKRVPGAEINVSIFIEFVQGLASADLSDVFSCRNGCQSNGRISEKGL